MNHCPHNSIDCPCTKEGVRDVAAHYPRTCAKIHFSREYSDVLALPMRNSTSAWFLWGPQMFAVRA